MVSTDGTSASGSSIGLTAPTGGGCYTCNLKVDSQNGTSYTTKQICVQKYDIWSSVMKKSGSNWDWAWRFSSSSNAYFHVQVLNDARQQVAASKLTVKLTKLTNAITGQTYTNPVHQVLNVTSADILLTNATSGGQGQPVINLSLSGLNLPSGFYQAEIQVTDDEGSVDSGTAFFQVSNLDVNVQTQRSGSSAFIFKPSDTIQLVTTAAYFNGTNVPNGSNVSVDKVLLISGASPKTISTDIYTSTTNTTLNGQATITLRPKTGKSLPSGDYLVFVKVNTGAVTETREAWFMVKSFFVYAYTTPYYYASPAEQKYIYGFVFDPDFNSMPDVQLTFDGFYDAKQFNLVKGINTPTTTSDTWGSFTLNVNSTPSTEGTYVYVIKAYNNATGEREEYMDYMQIQKFSNIDCSLVDSTQSTVTPSTTLNYKVTITDANGDNSGHNVSVSKFTDVNTWSDRTATTTSSGTTNNDGVATVTVTAPKVVGKFRPIVTVDGIELSSDTYSYGMWPCEVGVYKTEVNVQLQNSQSTQTTEFTSGSNISVNFLLSNPSGGAVSMNELKLVQYQCLTPDCKVGAAAPWTTELGAKKSSNFDTTNVLRFAAPQKKGTYMLVTQATDTDNAKTSYPVTFKVVEATFNYYIWPGNNYVDQGSDFQFSVDTQGTIKINVSSLKNIDTSQSLTPAGSETTFTVGQSTYNYSTTGLNPGTYEAELCVYTGSSCTNTSYKQKFVFTVASSYFAYGRPYDPMSSYAQGNNITLEVRLEDKNMSAVSLANNEITLFSVERGTQDFSSSFNVDVADSSNNGWKLVTLSGFSLKPGNYETVIYINKSGTVYKAHLFFYIKDFDFVLVTSDGPRVDSSTFQPPRYASGSSVTFNITGGANQTGKLYLYNTNGWVRMSQYTQNFTLNSNGFVQKTIEINDGNNYVAIAATPDIDTPGHQETHYPFDVVAGFDIMFDWQQMQSEIGVNNNLTLKFTVYEIDGVTPKNGGKINVTINKYLNPMNWNELNGSVGITGEADIAGDGTVTFNFNPRVGLGEYMAEIAFSIGGDARQLHTWFRVKGADFYVWTNEGSYNPGGAVTINTEIRSTDGSGLQDQTVQISELKYGTQNYSGQITTGIAQTDSSGRASLGFNIPSDKTGDFRVTINWTNTGETRTLTVKSTKFRVEVFDQTWPPYTGGGQFKMDVYVKDDNGPKDGVPVNYIIKNERRGVWTYVQNSTLAGNTDSNGKATITYNIPSDANGFYDMEINIGNGAATRWRGFQVNPFNVFVNLYGEKTGEDKRYNDWEMPSDATIVIPVEVKTTGGAAVVNATVTLEKVWRIGNMGGTDVTNSITAISTSDVTDSTGTAELRFSISNLTVSKDYDVQVKVRNSSGTESYMGKWFRISPYSWKVNLTTDPRLNDTSSYDIDSKAAGDLVFIRVNLTGQIDNKTRLCIDRAQSLRNGQTKWLNQCYNSTILTSNNGTLTVNFSAPYESGEYEAVVELRRYEDPQNNNQWFNEKETRLWFEVLGGEEANFNFNVWTETQNVWSGQNGTINVEIWSRNSWGNENESAICGNITIEEIRDAQTWTVVKTKEDINAWIEQPIDQWSPMTYLKFVVPTDLPAKEYNAKIMCENKNIVRDVWFRIASFQTAILMSENLMAKQNVTFWVKTTYFNGTPVANANITMVEIRNNWAGHSIEKTFNTINQTDMNGEFLGNFTAPNKTSEYELILKVGDGVDTQEIKKWFRIRGVSVDVDVGGGRDDVLFEGDDAKIRVMVSNAQTGAPIRDARVELNMWRHWFEDGKTSTFEQVDCYALNQSTQADCNQDNGCYWNQTTCIKLSNYCDQFNENECQSQGAMCWYDYGMQNCNAQEKSKSFDSGSKWEQKNTNYNGVAEFDFSGNNKFQKGEYEIDINVDAKELGWFWTHKTFYVRKLNLTLSTPKLNYWPGEKVQVNITAKYKNGTAVNGEYAVESSLERAKFAMMKEEMACMQKWDNASCNQDSNCEWMGFEDYNSGGSCDMYNEEQPCNDNLDCEWDINSSFCVSAALSPECAFCDDCHEGCADANCHDICDQTQQCQNCNLGPQYEPPVSGGGSGGSGGFCELKEMTFDTANATFINGLAKFNLTIPANQTAGPIMLITDIVDPNNCVEFNGQYECKAIEFLDGMILVMDNGTSAFSIVADRTIVSANQFISLNITTDPSEADKFALAPFVRHMQSAGGVVSMQELMGGGPESGKEDFYDGEIYLNPSGLTHTMILARNRPAQYIAMMPLQEKGSSSMSKSFENVFTLEYTVNSSAGECSKNFECNDNNNQTRDICVLLKCVYTNISMISCTSDMECAPNTVTNGNIGICDWSGQCMNVTAQCSADSECNDGNATTSDYCEYYNCKYEASANLQCTQSSQCTNYPGEGYVGFCEYGSYYYMLSNQVGCTSDAGCAQGQWCDQFDKQCKIGGSCECSSSDNCTQTPFGINTIAVCKCFCEYYDLSNIQRLYAWNKSKDVFGNRSGVTWGWSGNEGADEKKVFNENPGADITLAFVANDTNYIYTRIETGGLQWMGGIPYCGGSYPSNWAGTIKGEKFVTFYNTTAGGTCGNMIDADYKYEVSFTQTTTSKTGRLYHCSGGNWIDITNTTSIGTGINNSVDCQFGGIDFKVNRSLIGMNGTVQVVVATYMTLWETIQQSWTVLECQKDQPCANVTYYANNLTSLIDRVPNANLGWQWTNDTGGLQDEGGQQLMCVLNGDRTPQENCDDNNNNNGDGCDTSCNKEQGWGCTGNVGQISTCNLLPSQGMNVTIQTSEGNVFNVLSADNNSVTLQYQTQGNMSAVDYNHTYMFVDNGNLYNATRPDGIGNYNYVIDNVSIGAHTFTVELKNSTFGVIDAKSINFSVELLPPPPENFTVSGYVMDKAGNGVNDSTISLTGAQGNPFSKPPVFTDEQGSYNIDNVPKGLYNFKAEKHGALYEFEVMLEDNFNLTTNTTINVTVYNISVSSVTDAFVYKPGDNVTFNITVTNNEPTNLTDWEFAGLLFFQNQTVYQEINDNWYEINLSVGQTYSNQLVVLLNSSVTFNQIMAEGGLEKLDSEFIKVNGVPVLSDYVAMGNKVINVTVGGG